MASMAGRYPSVISGKRRGPPVGHGKIRPRGHRVSPGETMHAFLVAACAVLGLAVGSFLNVVIWRVPRKLSVVQPGSHCPGCEVQIRPSDNVPLVSWLLLRGKCRHCQAPIPVRYPLVEAGCAALFAAAALRFGASWALPGYLGLFAALLAISVIDLEHYIVPD